MNEFIITTTNNIEFGKVIRYIDIVSTNIVIGANVFSDIAAAFTDIFGGTSNSYQNKLEFITNMSKIKLQNKAYNLGANAILGYKIDIDEVSGTGKSMFMISAIGTAVYVEYNKDAHQDKPQGKLYNEELLKAKDQELTVQNAINGYMVPPEKRSMFDYNPIIDEAFIKKLIEHAIEQIDSNDADYQSYNNWIYNYLRNINTELPITILYNMYFDDRYENKKVTEVISASVLMSPKHALELFDKGIDVNEIIKLISADKEYYTMEDVQILEEIISKLNEIKPQCEYTTHKSIFGKESKKWTCICGKENDEEITNCTSCDRDICGLTTRSKKNIASLTQKIELIKKLLN